MNRSVDTTTYRQYRSCFQRTAFTCWEFVVALVIILVFMALLLPFVSRVDIPKYQGHSVSYWAAGLDDPDPAVRKGATTILIRALTEAEPRVRSAAARVLPRVPEDSRVVPALLRALNDAELGVRSKVADSLGGMGLRREIQAGHLQDVMEALDRKALNDPDDLVRNVASDALGRIRKLRVIDTGPPLKE